MRKFIVLMLLLLLTSCDNRNNSPSYFLDETENKSLESGINNESTGFTYADFEEIYLFCKLFLKEFYNATTTNETMNLDPYLYNNNLKGYVLQKIEVGSTIHTNRIKNLIFGIKDIDWYLDQGYMFIELFTDIEQEVGGFGEQHQFIISNKNGRMLISDWYSMSAGSVSHLDNIVREHTNKINNPDIWNDEEWVNNIFEAIDKIRTHSPTITESSSAPRIIKWKAEPSNPASGKSYDIGPGMRVASPTNKMRGAFSKVFCDAMILGITVNANSLEVGDWF